MFPGFSRRAGFPATGFWWKEKMPPMLKSPSLENMDSSVLPYGEQLGSSALLVNKVSRTRSANSSCTAILAVCQGALALCCLHRLYILC